MNLKMLLTTVCLLTGLYGPFAAGRSEAAAASTPQTAPSAKDAREQALQHKLSGDGYASQGDHQKASEEYLLALSLDSAAFTRDEKIRMATVLSWAKRFDDALAILRPIIAKDPKNHDARIQLARVLSWSGKQDEAEKEVDAVLAAVPDSPEARLVKANILRWKGDAAAAVPLYRKVLEGKEDFDARLGLAHAYIATGDARAAEDAGALLKPVSADQEKAVGELNKAYCAARTTTAGAQYSYYRDSDHNTVDRFAISSGMRGLLGGSGEAELWYRWTGASDPFRNESAREIWLSSKLRSGKTGVALGLGAYLTADGGGLPTGFARGEWSVGGGTIGIGAAREALTDTAQLIDQKIMRTIAAVSLSQGLPNGLTFIENYARSDYSDDNDSDDLILAAQKTLTRPGPLKVAGYRFRYLDFRRRTQGGYFDPSNYTSHQIFSTLNAEWDRFKGDLEPSVGVQSFLRDDRKTRQGFFSVTGTLGWKMNKCMTPELHAEGGNYAGGSTAGFDYYFIGVRLKASF